MPTTSSPLTAYLLNSTLSKDVRFTWVTLYKSVVIIKVTIIRFALQMLLTCGHDTVRVPYNCYLHMYTTVHKFFL